MWEQGAKTYNTLSFQRGNVDMQHDQSRIHEGMNKSAVDHHMSLYRYCIYHNSKLYLFFVLICIISNDNRTVLRYRQ